MQSTTFLRSDLVDAAAVADLMATPAELKKTLAERIV
jgi:hypothetical protein